MGSLHTYELQVLADDNPDFLRKSKLVTFTTETETETESDAEDLDDESLALLTKKFRKILGNHFVLDNLRSPHLILEKISIEESSVVSVKATDLFNLNALHTSNKRNP